MLELPEAVVLAEQINRTLIGKRICNVVANHTPHKFAWFTGDPAEYPAKLVGKVIGTATAWGVHVEIEASNMLLVISTGMRYHADGAQPPQKHQLYLNFEDGTAFTLIIVAYLFVTSGGAFFVLGPQDPGWLRTGVAVAGGLMMLFSIFLAAAVLYLGLSGAAPLNVRFPWSLALVVALVAGSAYQVFWDGIWSSAHGRAFEDHLPFAHFMVSLMAGGLLVASLRGWRRLSGPGLVLLVTTITTLALILGWNVSAFQLTERRAERVNQAVIRYYEDSGRYPTQLGELTPGYLLFVPPPVVVRQGGWCYQGGAAGYRLGYVSGHFTYFTSSIEAITFAQVGQPPSGDWNCDRIAAEIQAAKTW